VQTRPILVIDDDQVLRELAGSVLTGAGFRVLEAPDGLAGIKLAQTAQPAVILLDMTLPGLDGVRTCQRLKQDEPSQTFPWSASRFHRTCRTPSRPFAPERSSA